MFGRTKKVNYQVTQPFPLSFTLFTVTLQVENK